MLLSLLFLLPAAVFAMADSLLEFGPSGCSFTDTDDTSKMFFTIKLKVSSTETAFVYLGSDQLMFSTAMVTLPANSTAAVTVNFRPVLNYVPNVAPSDVLVKAKTLFQSKASEFDSSEQVFPIHRTYITAMFAIAHGDPHIYDWSGNNIDGMTTLSGTYYLFKNADLEIQCMMQGPSATFIQAVAIRYGKSLFMVKNSTGTGSLPITISDSDGNMKISFDSNSAPNTDQIMAWGDGQVLSITLPGQNKISITLHNNSPRYFDISLFFQTSYMTDGGLVKGLGGGTSAQLAAANAVDASSQMLLGAFTGNVPDVSKVYVTGVIPSQAQVHDWVAATVTSQSNARQTSSLIALTASLVSRTSELDASATAKSLSDITSTLRINEDATSSALAAAATLAAQNGAVGYKAPPAGYVVYVAPTQIYCAPSTNPPTDLLPASVPPTEDFKRAAKVYCQDLYPRIGCEKCVDPQKYVDACIIDTINTGSYSAAQGSLRTYLSVCNSLNNYGLKNPSKIIRQESLATLIDNQLGSNPCTSSCSNQGQCTQTGCVCDSNWGGVDCSINLAKQLSFSPASNTFCIGGANERPNIPAVSPAHMTQAISPNVKALPSGSILASLATPTGASPGYIAPSSPKILQNESLPAAAALISAHEKVSYTIGILTFATAVLVCYL